MGQVTIYLDDETEQMMVTSAEERQLSKSKWVASVIREKLTTSWPVTVTEAVGTWADFPSVETLRGRGVADKERERL